MNQFTKQSKADISPCPLSAPACAVCLLYRRGQAGHACPGLQFMGLHDYEIRHGEHKRGGTCCGMSDRSAGRPHPVYKEGDLREFSSPV